MNKATIYSCVFMARANAVNDILPMFPLTGGALGHSPDRSVSEGDKKIRNYIKIYNNICKEG